MSGRSRGGGDIDCAVSDGSKALGVVGDGPVSGSAGSALEGSISSNGGAESGAVVDVSEAGAVGEGEAETSGTGLASSGRASCGGISGAVGDRSCASGFVSGEDEAVRAGIASGGIFVDTAVDNGSSNGNAGAKVGDVESVGAD